eukprot:TRINITY_DN661_c0_g1_i2.p1 TRINITY_DN661_c0_g1~~TRINITY_DN661_c0_g1_i2.p1  ORF type:complete len:401 (+),score=52.26 TRINITY_DN661_c0_g1_i2:46-1248(+)
MVFELQKAFAMLERAEGAHGGDLQMVNDVCGILRERVKEIERRESTSALQQQNGNMHRAADDKGAEDLVKTKYVADEAMRNCGYVCHPHSKHPTYTLEGYHAISQPQPQQPQPQPPTPLPVAAIAVPTLTPLPSSGPAPVSSPSTASTSSIALPKPPDPPDAEIDLNNVFVGLSPAHSLSPPVPSPNYSPYRRDPLMSPPIASVMSANVSSPHSRSPLCRKPAEPQGLKDSQADVNYVLGTKNRALTKDDLEKLLEIAYIRHGLLVGNESSHTSPSRIPVSPSPSSPTKRPSPSETLSRCVVYAGKLHLEPTRQPAKAAPTLKSSGVNRSQTKISHVSNRSVSQAKKKKKKKKAALSNDTLSVQGVSVRPQSESMLKKATQQSIERGVTPEDVCKKALHM